MATPILTIPQLLTYTDHVAGLYEAAAESAVLMQAKTQALVTTIYGDGTAAVPSLGNPDAMNGLGGAARRGQMAASGAGPFTGTLGTMIAALSSLLAQHGGAASGYPAEVRDIASWVRQSNACPDPSGAGGGAGSNYAHLLHPSFAALQALATANVSVFPPDIVFAPSGLVLSGFDAAAGTFAPGQALMTPAAPYAPATGWQVQAGATVPNGSLLITLAGVNQAGANVTWRGDAGTGLAHPGDLLPPGTLKGTEGGAAGGTAAPGDRLTQITGIARDMSVNGGGTATTGTISLITVAQRGTL